MVVVVVVVVLLVVAVVVVVVVVTVAVAEAEREYENLEGAHVRTTCTRNANGRSSGVPLLCGVLKNSLRVFYIHHWLD